MEFKALSSMLPQNHAQLMEHKKPSLSGVIFFGYKIYEYVMFALNLLLL